MFWVVVGLVFWGGKTFVTNQTSRADVNVVSPETQALSSRMDITITETGRVSLNNKPMKARITPLKDTDRIQIILLGKTNQPTYGTDAIVTLPASVTVNSVVVTPRLIHNFTSDVTKTILSRNSFELKTDYIDGQASYSLELDFPKGALNLPLGTKLIGWLIAPGLGWWIAFALILPLVTLIILSALLIKHFGLALAARTKLERDIPPANLPPAVAEVLLRGKLSPRSVAATLVDLARRGYLIIGYHEDTFRFGKHRTFKLPTLPIGTSGNLNSDVEPILAAVAQIKDQTDIRFFERLILSKIFRSEQMVIDQKDIELRIGHRLFSEKMALVYSEIYRLATEQGFFITDPNQQHRRYKNLGLVLFTIGLAGLIISAIKFPDPKTAVFGWIGMMLAAVVMVKMSPRLSVLSPTGIAAYKQWSAFKAYLANPRPLMYTEQTAKQFDSYLPYAIALGVEREWTARFREHPFLEPGWFASESESLSLQDFDNELFPLINWVGQHLSLARTPIID